MWNKIIMMFKNNKIRHIFMDIDFGIYGIIKTNGKLN